MKKIIISALLTISLAACGGSKTADIMTGGPDNQTAKVVTAKAVLEKMSSGKYREGQLLVKFKEGVSAADMNTVHQSAGSTVIRKLSGIDNLYVVKLPAGLSVEDAIGIYMGAAVVDYAEPDYTRSILRVPNDPYFNPQQWALQNTGAYANGTIGADIKAPGAWDVTTGTKSVAVAVVDTGIDYTHPDLVGNMWADRVKVLLKDTHWLGHDTFKIVGEQVIYTDPFNIQKTDVADIILISHDHYDHCSPADVVKILGPATVIVTTADCAKRLADNVPLLKPQAVPNIRIVTPGVKLNVGGIDIEAVPAYNITIPHHPKYFGWVGYIFTVNRNRDINAPTDITNPGVDLNQDPGPRVYFAGDTDLIPEMMQLPIRGVDLALLPVSGVEGMNADEAALAALHIRPKVAVPMHYGSIMGTTADARRFADLLEGTIEVAIMVDQSGGYTASTIEYDNNKMIDDWRGWNFVDGNNDPWDDEGHGTHVAGIIGATGNNGEGIAGVNWRVELMPLKVCDSAGLCSSSDVIDAIGYATFKGVKIINASLGGSGLSYAMRDVILAARQAGVLIITSAGNGSDDIPGDFSGDNNDVNPVFPASFALDNVISVAATDQNDMRTTFSNFGLETVHVAAPGTYILSTVPTASTIVQGWQTANCSGTPLAGYNTCSGTSIAAPHVAGLAALLYNVYPNFTYSQIRGMIIKYVDKQPSLEGRIYSGGRINAQRAVTSLLSPAGFAVSSALPSELTISWSDNSGEDVYVIEKKSQQDDSYVEIGQTGQNVTSFTDRGLAAGTSYTYRIKAVSSLPNPPNRLPVAAESGYSYVTGITPGQQVNAGGGGGGCSVGPRQNLPTAAADSAVILLPLIVLGLIRSIRRRK